MADASTVQLIVVAAAGGVGGNLLTTLTRRVEFRREDRARWLTHREEAYAGMLSAAGGAAQSARQMAPVKGVPDDHAAPQVNDILSHLDEMAVHLGRVRLLAPRGLVQLADVLQEATVDHCLDIVAHGAKNADDAPVMAARDAFRTAARDDLGVEARAWHVRRRKTVVEPVPSPGANTGGMTTPEVSA